MHMQWASEIHLIALLPCLKYEAEKNIIYSKFKNKIISVSNARHDTVT